MRGRRVMLLAGFGATAIAAGAVVSVALPGAPAADAAAPASVIYGGLTSQGEPMILEVTPARTRVVKINWDWRASCRLGPAAAPGTPTTASWSDTAARFPITAGRWRGSFTAGPFTKSGTGVVQRFTYRFAGVVRAGGRMSGSVRATYREDLPGGRVRDCSSGAITFTLRD